MPYPETEAPESSLVREDRFRSFHDDDARWASVRDRDAAADGAFLYSVKTTRVYCRPSCPSRTARRENVAFHASAADAERAGFRACKRCLPKRTGETDGRTATVEALCRILEQSDTIPSLDALASEVGLSRFQVHRLFVGATGLTPRKYAEAKRDERLRSALGDSATVLEAVFDAGFRSTGRFYERSNAALGMTPTDFRRRGERQTIRFAVGQCSLGAILVAATSIGVCAVLLDDDPEVLVRDLEHRFPRATLIGGDEAFEQTVARVVGMVERPDDPVALPLDIRGTAFQKRVYDLLREIPVGTTRTYSELAERLGSRSSVRAVARACASNPIAVAIPCHRVVRIDGSLAGYRWGIERKRALLERESNP